MEKQLFEKLSALKDKHGMTQADICKRTGIPEGTLGKIFSGETASPRFDVVMQILSAMDEKAEALYGAPPQAESSIFDIPTGKCRDCHARAAILESYRNSLENQRLANERTAENMRQAIEDQAARYERQLRLRERWLTFCVVFITLQFFALFYIATRL